MPPTDAQPNGPREKKSHGRLRHTLTNTASKQNLNNNKPGKASYGASSRPKTMTTPFESGQRLKKLAASQAPAQAPSVNAPPAQSKSSITPVAAMASLAGALAQLRSNQSGNTDGTSIGGGGTPQANIQLGKQVAKEFGWTNEQWRALKQLGMRESGWRTDAANPTSSARGIAQAMMSVHFGKDWKNSPDAKKYLSSPESQIRWMANYIKGRYGSPQAALQFHNKNQYY